MKPISTTNAPAAIGPYSQGMDIGNLVFTSGQIPVNPADGTIPDGIEAQAHRSCQNVGAILQAAGSSFDQVIKTTCFLADMADFAQFNAVYETFFTAPYPARSCVQVAGIPKGAKVEIECIATINE